MPVRDVECYLGAAPVMTMNCGTASRTARTSSGAIIAGTGSPLIMRRLRTRGRKESLLFATCYRDEARRAIADHTKKQRVLV